MKITRDNYEPFFLDYLEGNLDEALIDQFLDFLKQNPDLKEELQLFDNSSLPVDPVEFKGKESLYKTSEGQSESFDRMAVAYMEGDLKNKERKVFEASLERNPQLRKEMTLFEMTRLIPDASIQYPVKGKLYHRSATMVWLTWTARAAAVFILLFGVYSLLQRNADNIPPTTNPRMASVKVPTPVPSQPNVNNPAKEQPVASTTPSKAKVSATVKHSTQAVVDKPALNETTETEPRRETEAVEAIAPILAQLETNQVETTLESTHSMKFDKLNDPHNIMTLDEYLASRARKVTNEGLLSANRLLRVGLNVASEISGDRLGYTVKNGKVSSVGFESKLLAFEIPLEKK